MLRAPPSLLLLPLLLPLPSSLSPPSPAVLEGQDSPVVATGATASGAADVTVLPVPPVLLPRLTRGTAYFTSTVTAVTPKASSKDAGVA